MSAERDTQFAGFAKALLLEMIEEEFGQLNVNALDTGIISDLEKIIAQRAYDLAKHVSFYTDDGFVTDDIPDLATFSEEPA
jgi:hypothetical protein